MGNLLFFGFFIDFLVISLFLNFASLSIVVQTCQLCKEILTKDIKEPGDSVKNLEALVGYFFLSYKLGFFP